MAKKAKKNGKTNGKHKPNGNAKKKWVGKPGEYRTVLRIPEKLAARLTKASKKNSISINEALKTLVEVWVKGERC